MCLIVCVLVVLCVILFEDVEYLFLWNQRLDAARVLASQAALTVPIDAPAAV